MRQVSFLQFDSRYSSSACKIRYARKLLSEITPG